MGGRARMEFDMEVADEIVVKIKDGNYHNYLFARGMINYRNDLGLEAKSKYQGFKRRRDLLIGLNHTKDNINQLGFEDYVGEYKKSL